MRRPPSGPGITGTARALQRNLTPYHYVDSPFQWGYVNAVHASATTSLSATATQGTTSIQTNGYISPNSILMIGTLATGIRTSAVSGTTAPYTVTLIQPVPITQSSGATVTILATVDLYLDGAQVFSNTSYLVPGILYISTYTPTVGDVVLVARGTGHLKSDRVVLGKLT